MNNTVESELKEFGELSEEIKPRNSFQFAILMGLQSKPIYRGTVSPEEKAKRRKAGKVAKAQRKRNR